MGMPGKFIHSYMFCLLGLLCVFRTLSAWTVNHRGFSLGAASGIWTVPASTFWTVSVWKCKIWKPSIFSLISIQNLLPSLACRRTSGPLDCPICSREHLVRLDKHLLDGHQIMSVAVSLAASTPNVKTLGCRRRRHLTDFTILLCRNESQ